MFLDFVLLRSWRRSTVLLVPKAQRCIPSLVLVLRNGKHLGEQVGAAPLLNLLAVLANQHCQALVEAVPQVADAEELHLDLAQPADAERVRAGPA